MTGLERLLVCDPGARLPMVHGSRWKWRASMELGCWAKRELVRNYAGNRGAPGPVAVPSRGCADLPVAPEGADRDPQKRGRSGRHSKEPKQGAMPLPEPTATGQWPEFAHRRGREDGGGAGEQCPTVLGGRSPLPIVLGGRLARDACRSRPSPAPRA